MKKEKSDDSETAIPSASDDLSKSKDKESNKAFLLISLLIVIALLIASYARNTIWKDDLTLWDDVVKKSPNKAREYNNLGVANFHNGQYDVAIDNYNKAITLNISYAKAYYSRGLAYARKGQYDLAINDYNMALL